ncbi:suppressor of fused domain protein [Polyangium spumosum]|uniref:suppressor of fused domain protein n=1 Tax=Polyangium spumosum TaxID=889282 RepID=UPI0014780775
MAAYFKRRLGRAQVVRRETIPSDVHVIPPCKRRRHWILHTMGMSAYVLKGRMDVRMELVMSVSEAWDPRHEWPVRMLCKASRAIVTAGKAPVEGATFLNSREDMRRSPDVFALVLARSRQLRKHAQLRTVSGNEFVVYALYPLTAEELAKFRGFQLDVNELPKVLAWVPPKPRLVLHRFNDRDMIEVHVRTRYGPLVYVYFGDTFHGLFADHRLGRRVLGRARVIDEAVEDAVAWQHILFRPAIEAALGWARGREREYRDCDYPLGHPEMCWREFYHGPQPELPELPELGGYARPFPWST